MPLLPGFRFGAYEVLTPLGAGGMGEVYRARDTKLQRDVAVKVLPDLFAGDPERLARFQREAQLLASLNHPNIGGIYGFEEAQGVGALVLELIEGPTLAERIRQSPIPVEDALPIARQISDALEAAHDRGIIHRDLKPANIKLRPDGTVKVLDFGLAKALEPLVTGDAAASPTMTSPAMTGAGVVLGTATYMAPEQAKGREVDRTADVWAFGCVLYEMLAGRAPFEGATVTEVLAGVLKTEPDWQHLPPTTPEGIRRLLRRCLQKDPRRRLQHIGDARIEIDEAQVDPKTDGHAAPIAARGRQRLPWMLGVLVAFGAGVMLGSLVVRRAAPGAEARLDITTPPTTDPLSLAISPDGQAIVFVATDGRQAQLWLRRIDSTSAQPLPGTHGGFLPFWSPDSRSIGFFVESKLKRIDVESKAVQTLANAANGMGGTWNQDDTIVFAPSITSNLFQISARGGERSPATRTGERQLGHRHPQFLPDGRRFLYHVSGSAEAGGTYVGGLDGSAASRVLAGDTPALYAPSGHLLFVRQGTLFAQEFDPDRLTLTGSPIRVVDRMPGDSFGVPLSVSAAGPIAYRAGAIPGRRQFVWVDRSGKEVERVGEPDDANALSPSMSQDGTRVALHRTVNGNTDIWWFETRRPVLKRLTTDSVNDIHPVWSPDGSRVVYASLKKGAYDLYQAWLTQPDKVEPLVETGQSKRPQDWSHDGSTVLYREFDPKTGSDIWGLRPDGDRKPFGVVRTEFEERDAQLSPDGKWIAYESTKSGRSEVVVQPFSASGPQWQISSNGGAQPRWRRDGREVFYIGLDGRLMAVPLRTTSDGSTVEAGAPLPLFDARVGAAVQRISGPQYMVTPDGQRFLMNRLTEETHTSPITVILNWKPNSR